MEGYILRTDTRIAPFGDPVGETPVLDTTLERYQQRALSECCSAVHVIDDLEQIRASEFLLIEDHVFLTRFFLRAAMKAAGKAGGATRFALGESYFLKEKSPLGGLDVRRDDSGAAHAPLPVVLWRGAPFAARELPTLPLTRVAVGEHKYAPELVQEQPAGSEFAFSLTREGVMSVRHWSHIPDINQLALIAYWIDWSPKNVLWLLWKAATAFSVNKWKILGNMNVVGRGCDIHPTAHVAASVLGDKVSIGPHSVVAGSFLGDGSKVESLSDVFASVIGEKGIVSWRTKVNYSILYPRSLVSYPAAQMCVLGRQAQHLGGCFPIDTKLSQDQLLDVRVKHQGAVVDSGKKFLGVCLGHQAIVGTGVWLNSGVEVPNRYTIVRDKADIVSKIPDGFEKVALSLQEGELRPYGKKTG